MTSIVFVALFLQYNTFMNVNRILNVVSVVVILAMAVLSVYFYPQLPERVASHWNAAGTPDDTMSRLWGVLLIPLIAIGVFVLLKAVPFIDPKRHNIAEFRKYYDGFIVVMLLFLLYVHALVLVWNVGVGFHITRVMIPGLAVLFFYIGVMLRHAKQNWTVGIRTPWTLSDDRVWEHTHILGGRLFIAASIILLGGVLFPSHLVWFVVAPLVLVALVTTVYSYFLYNRYHR